MNNFRQNQNSTLTKGYTEDLELIILKYTRTIKITKILIFCTVILLIASLFFSPNKYNFKSVPINYERFTADSVKDSYYYIDSIISCSESFELIRTNTVNNVTLDTSISTYYFAEDKNGFAFFIHADSNGKDYLENSMRPGNQDLILYGTLTTLPTDIESIPPTAVKNLPKYVSESLHNKNEEFISYVNRHKILHIYSNPPKEQSVNDGINPTYEILNIIRLSLFVVFIALLIFKKRYTAKHTNIWAEAVRLQSLKNGFTNNQ